MIISWLFVGISHSTKKIPNPGDFAAIPVIKIPKLRKIPNPEDKNPETKKIPNPGDKNPETKKIPNSEDKNPETKENPEYRGFAENPESRGYAKNLGDFQKIPNKSRLSENRENSKFYLIFLNQIRACRFY